MAKPRRVPEPPPPGPPTISPAQALRLLAMLIDKGKALLAARPLSSDEHENWTLLARNYLEKAFGTNSPNVASVMDVGVYGAFPMNAGEEWWEEHRADTLTTQIKRVEGLIELLNTEAQLVAGEAPMAAAVATGHRVFLVHGHDEALLHETARFLGNLDQDFIILREQPNRGRTIIEKFEDYADVGFAVVLLTPDDRGGVAAEAFDKQTLRARQNVILELGYFLGRLGRSRVCALYRPGVRSCQ